MLKNLNPILSPDLLHVLASMGHGDELVLVDCNFPCASIATDTVVGEPIWLASADITAAAEAILSVFPLDSFVEEPVLRMEVVGKPDELTDCHREMRRIMDATSDRTWSMGTLERLAFYERARKAFAVVCAAGENRGYGCFILTKGVIDAAGNVV
jgi:L-fucose mutarotase